MCIRDRGQDPLQRAIWHGLLASWSFELCDLATGRTAQQDALTQLAAAQQAGRADSALVRRNEEAFAAELRRAEERCGKADRTDRTDRTGRTGNTDKER